MADDEQFSLCWNNFNSNLSAGFHESLCRGDLVDVTLAAEGQLVKAHRLVLSVCSPYFRKMFTQMPPNQHAFVFLKDVSHTALKDLIQFMYCGEVNVKQEALPAFISTAEALQIKGLTDSDPPAPQSPAKPSTPAPQPSPIQQIPSPRVRHRASTSRSYNIESIEDSIEDSKQATQIVIQTTPQKAQTTTIVQQTQQHHHQTQQQHYQPQQTTTTVTTANVTHKRPAQRTSSGISSQTKRTKSTIDPLEATETVATSQQISVQTVVPDTKPIQQIQQQQQQQQQNEPEFMDLPIELPTKSEPDYTEETGEAEAAEQEATYVEDDSYGDMRYDESYFTENEDAANATATGVSGNIGGAGASTSKAIVKQQAFSDTSYAEAADPSNNEAQGKLEYEEVLMPIQSAVDNQGPVYVVSKYGTKQLVLKQHTFNRHVNRDEVTYWRCSQFAVLRCRARIKTKGTILTVLNSEHNHPVITKARKYGSLKTNKLQNAVNRSQLLNHTADSCTKFNYKQET